MRKGIERPEKAHDLSTLQCRVGISRAMQLMVVMSLVALVACFGMSQVTPIGTVGEPLGEGCPVKLFPATTPNYTWEDIASTQARCMFLDRNSCIHRLKRDACSVGGDTVYGFSEGVQGDFIIISATIAKRTNEPARVRGTTSGTSASGPVSPPSSPRSSPIRESEAMAVINSVRPELMECIARSEPSRTALSLRVQVNGDGTAIYLGGEPSPPPELSRCLRELVSTLHFRVTRAEPVVVTTPPLHFAGAQSQ